MSRSLFSPKHDRLRRLLIEARRHAGLTQMEVAKRLRRPQSYISKLEIGERRIDAIELLELAAVLGVDGCDLLAQVQR